MQERKGAYRVWWEDMMERYCLLDLGVDGNSIGMNLQELEWRVGLGLD
jgi:hypothetical protein